MRLALLAVAVMMFGCDSAPEGDGDASGPDDDAGEASAGDADSGSDTGAPALCEELVDPPVRTAVLMGRDPVWVPLAGMCMTREPGEERFDYYITPDPGLHPHFWEYPTVNELILDAERLQQYDLLVVAKKAGSDTDDLWESAVFMENAAAPNLREFVRNGGNILTSEEGFVELLFPAVVDFRGGEEREPGETEMVTSTGFRHGRSEDPLRDPEVRPMDVVDADLRRELEALQCENLAGGREGPCVEGDGPLEIWVHDAFAVMEGAHPGADLEILLEGEVFFYEGDFEPLGSGVHPMVVRFQEGEGTIVYSAMQFTYIGINSPNGRMFELMFDSLSR